MSHDSDDGDDSLYELQSQAPTEEREGGPAGAAAGTNANTPAGRKQREREEPDKRKKQKLGDERPDGLISPKDTYARVSILSSLAEPTTDFFSTVPHVRPRVRCAVHRLGVVHAERERRRWLRGQ